MAAAGAALVLALIVFTVRTALQPQYRPGDFALYYTASKAWLLGENPYDTTRAAQLWTDAGGRPDIMPIIDGEQLAWQPIILLPQTFPLLVPLVLVPANPAVVIWYALAGLLLIAQTAALADLIGSRLWQPRGMLLLAITLVLAPVHECFGYAQPSGPAISILILGTWAAIRRRDLLAGVLIALAAALKPQLGGVLFLYYLLMGRWRLVGVAATIGAILIVASVTPMALRGTPWFESWQAHMAEVDRIGGYNSPFPENPMRRHMLNLQMILGGILMSFTAVNLTAIALTLALAVLLGIAVHRGRRAADPQAAPDELLVLSAVLVLGLLPVYHRFYDAAVLVMPIAWAVGNFQRRALESCLVLAFGLSFVLPVPVTARALQFIGRDPDQVSGLWWDFLVEPWRVWVLLVGLLLLVGAIARSAPEAIVAPESTDELDGREPELVGEAKGTADLAAT